MGDWTEAGVQKRDFQHSDRIEDWEEVKYRRHRARRRGGKRMCAKFDGPCNFTVPVVLWTFYFKETKRSQMAMSCDRCGRRDWPTWWTQHTPVVQLDEQLPTKEYDAGSNPVRGTK